jgi:hypothetical protein
MAEDVTDASPPAKAPIILEEALVKESYAQVGTTAKWKRCIRCLRIEGHVHRRNCVAACTRKCVLCDKTTHKGRPCPLMDKYPNVFTVAYLTAHFPEAIQAGKQAEQASKGMGAGKPAPRKHNQRNAKSSQLRDDRYHRYDTSSRYRDDRNYDDERSSQNRDDRYYPRSPGYHSRSWDPRDQRRLRSPYDQRDRPHRPHSWSRSRLQEQRGRQRSPPQHSSRGQQRRTEEGESSPRNPMAAELHRDRMAQKQASEQQQLVDNLQASIDEKNVIIDNFQVRMDQALERLQVSKDQELEEKDRQVQHLAQAVGRIDQQISELQQKYAVATNTGSSLAPPAPATRSTGTQTSGPASRAKKSSRTASSTAQNSAAMEGEEEWRRMYT